jgi:hypothetical protein
VSGVLGRHAALVAMGAVTVLSINGLPPRIARLDEATEPPDDE